jgi:hypothetical protein
MKNLKTQKELGTFLQTSEAFEGEFAYKGISIWWNNYDAKGVQSPKDGYFRCDPFSKGTEKTFNKLSDNEFGGFEWDLS